jgi:integrase
MKGHIKERSPGHWAIVLDTQDPATGKRKRKWHSFRGTKREAQVECARLVAQRSAGDYIEPAKATVEQFLARWLEYKKARLSALSCERYGDIIRLNIVPAIGNLPLAKLQPVAIASLEAKAREKLAARSVLSIHRVLRQALSQAVRWQLLTRNPADAVQAPKVERHEMKALDTNGIVALLDAARGTALYIPILLAALLGLRRGEVAALRWRSIRLDSGQLSVVATAEQSKDGVREKAPKGGRPRTVAMPAVVVDELRRHRLSQAENLLRLGVRLTDDHHVVARADGQPYHPRSLTQMFEQLLDRRPSLSRIRFHDLRHSHATQLLASGIHPKIAQERLGHSSIAMTMDLYSHVLPGMQEDAADKVDAAVRQAMDWVAKR